MSESKKTWKQKAVDALKSYYLGFEGTQWHEFDRSRDRDIIQVKIAYAVFGPPSQDTEDIHKAYKKEQRSRANEIIDLIFKVYDDAPVSNLRIGFIFVFCKQEESEFILPVFSVYVGSRNGKDLRKFVGTDGRIYSDWADWKNNNALPKMSYAYPKHGYFTCREGAYEFDPQRNPVVEYGESPQCSTTQDVLKGVDIATSIISIGSGIVGIAACFTPLAPFVLATAAVAGTSSAVYGAGRGVSTLVDKGTHGQSLSDLESMTTWFSIIATPLTFVSSTVNGTLALGARQGRIFSGSMRMFATVVNFMTLGVDTVLFGFGIANLIKKANKGDLTTMDVLQFSISTFFFTNTLIQPRVASKIIRQAQEMHFGQVASSMTDAETKKAFDKFLQQNRASGSITERSKIIRTVNRMEDPSRFFKAVGPEQNVQIGGRKGKTVLVSDQHGFARRYRPDQYTAMHSAVPARPVDFAPAYDRLKKLYSDANGREVKPEDVKLNGVKIFENLSDREKHTIASSLPTHKNHAEDILLTAHGIAEKLNCKTSDELMSVVQILTKHLSGKKGSNLQNALGLLRSGSHRDQFVKGIQRDMRTATEYARRGGLSFRDPLTAVYHYRKHGAEFPNEIQKFGNSLKVYIGRVKNRVFENGNLVKVSTDSNGTVRHIYVTDQKEFGVITSVSGGPVISTIHRNPKACAEHAQNLANFFQNHVPQGPPEPASDVAARLARFLGLREIQVLVSINGKEKPLKEWHDLDPSVHEQIAHFLNSVSVD